MLGVRYKTGMKELGTKEPICGACSYDWLNDICIDQLNEWMYDYESLIQCY